MGHNKYTTSCSKLVWVVTLKEPALENGLRIQQVAAWDFTEVLTYFTEEAKTKIIEVKNTGTEVTYHY